jgi:hypothetical protein
MPIRGIPNGIIGPQTSAWEAGRDPEERNPRRSQKTHDPTILVSQAR